MHARGHVEFINSALKYMKEYGLQKDLDIYKSLLNIFPKGPMIPKNIFQVWTVCVVLRYQLVFLFQLFLL